MNRKEPGIDVFENKNVPHSYFLQMADYAKLRNDFWTEDKSTVRQTWYKGEANSVIIKSLLRPQSNLKWYLIDPLKLILLMWSLILFYDVLYLFREKHST